MAASVKEFVIGHGSAYDMEIRKEITTSSVYPGDL